MIRILAAMAILLLATGCTKHEYSAVMVKAGVVYDTSYVPSGEGHDTAIGFNTGKGGGVTVTPVDIKIPERYAMVIDWSRGKTPIDGDLGKELYGRLRRGDSVAVSYREIYEVHGEEKRFSGIEITDVTKVEAAPK